MQRKEFDEDELVRLYESGTYTGREAMAMVGAPYQRGWKVLRARATERIRGQYRWDIGCSAGPGRKGMDFDEQELVQLYQSGMTGAEALQAVGLSAGNNRGWGVLRDRDKNPQGIRPPKPKGNGGRVYKSDGYVQVYIPKDHPFIGMAHKGMVAEHRLVMAEKLGRPLTDLENVHHLNGVRGDNRPENLELWHKPQPKGVRSGAHCPTCTCQED